jgi:hypothetical protein
MSLRESSSAFILAFSLFSSLFVADGKRALDWRTSTRLSLSFADALKKNAAASTTANVFFIVIIFKYTKLILSESE